MMNKVPMLSRLCGVGAGALAAGEARAKDAARQAAFQSSAAAGASSTALVVPRSAAEMAFAAHAQAEASKGNSIMDMFNVDFNDPFAAPIATAAPVAPPSAYGGYGAVRPPPVPTVR